MTLKITADNIDLGTLTSVTGPKITLIDYPGDDLATLPAGGATVAITGTGFVNGCQVLVDSTYATTVTFVSSTSITFTTPAMTAGTYPLYVINPDGGTAIAIPGISYSGVPAFSTGSGSIGSAYESTSFSSTIAATSDSTIAYTVDSGALPAGFSLNANTGAITGNAGSVTNSTTYNFTIKATDAELQDTNRSFSITLNPDVVTFNTPASNQTYSNITGNTFNLTLNATSASGQTVSYTANTLPGGITLSGNLISGTFNAASSAVSLITATAATTLKTATRLLTWAVTSPTISVDYLAVAGGGGGGARYNYNFGALTAAGGGGAGGLLSGTATMNSGTTYTVTIGSGGAGGNKLSPVNGTKGANTAISGTGLSTILCYGGGYGGGDNGQDANAGGNGGSGGAVGDASLYNGGRATGKGVYPGSSYISEPRQGYDGGPENSSSGGGGPGGGGAGGAGNAQPAGYTGVGGAGGVGLQSSITGTAIYYAGGGGGGSRNNTGGAGGSGGGGAGGGNTPGTGSAGTANTGGGGGAGASSQNGTETGNDGFAGGSGVVILRYADSAPAATSTTGSPTVTVSGGYRVYQFTSSGSITF